MARRMTRTENKEAALEAYMEALFTAQEAAERINEYLQENGETSPDSIHWGHVGSMQRIANELNQLKDMIDGTGEYSN